MNRHTSPDTCIACTTCVVQCPVAEATTQFLGPRMIGPAYERFRLLGLSEDTSLQYCANCKNCDISCPQGVPVSRLNMLARAEQCRRHSPGLRDWILGHGECMAKWLRYVPAPLKNFGMLNPVSRTLLDAVGIDKRAPLPAFAPRTFRQMLRHVAQPQYQRRVVFYPGCYVDVYDPQTGLDMVWVLNRMGYTVIVPDTLVCCGLPLISNGFWRHARSNAERNLQTLAPWQEKDIPLITGCPSCALMFRVDMPEYFPDLIQKYGACRLLDAQQFLVEAKDNANVVGRISYHTSNFKHLIYHAPCHLRAQGNGLPGLELVRSIPGLRVDNADAGCCGISGSYGFKKEKYAIAQTIGSRLFDTVRKSGAEGVISECGTCRVQLRHGTGKPVFHPVTLLRHSLEA